MEPEFELFSAQEMFEDPQGLVDFITKNSGMIITAYQEDRELLLLAAGRWEVSERDMQKQLDSMLE